MSFTPNPSVVPARDSLPLKKRDPKPVCLQQKQQCDAQTFKVPYPYKSQSESKIKPTSPLPEVPRRVPALYQPWMQTHTSSRSKPCVLSSFREHHDLAEWSQFTPLHPGWDFYRYCLGPPHRSARYNPVPLVAEGSGLEYRCEQLKILRDNSLNTARRSNGRTKGPYYPRGSSSSSTCLPHSPHEDLVTLQHDALYTSDEVLKHPGSASPNISSYMCTSLTDEASQPPSSKQTTASSSSCDGFPWLLPHFVAGSLIELRDGRLRRVEHLQTEDFLLGSLACPDLRLSCCTVQSISSSASSVSRLLILLHDQQSQESVDVYEEYPFFVRGQGWSSCSPQRTARLCGLHCRQLSVGDVCLALTPIAANRPPLPSIVKPENSPGEPLRPTSPQDPRGPGGSTGGQKQEAGAVRRRHNSAP